MTLEELIKSAESGNPEAQYELGSKYYNGNGVEKDDNKAFYWARLSSAGNYPQGMNLLALCYFVGKGVEKDNNRAVEGFRRAAEQGYAVAQYNLATCYESGRGVVRDSRLAFEWYKKAAEQGYALAQKNLGLYYVMGIGTAKDELESVKWIRKAAEQGIAEAQHMLGQNYEYGKCGVEKDQKQAVEWFKKAAEQGLDRAQNDLGYCYNHGEGVEKDQKQAVEWYTKAAAQGIAHAQNNLGTCYKKGEGVEKDEKQAVEWIRKAAEQGLDVAQYNLGVCYEHGEGVEKDEKQAVEWYKKAAEHGYANAQCKLGVCYEQGTGVEKDEKQAVVWYRRAALNGDLDAKLYLGKCYLLGQGVEKDEKQAVALFREAAYIGSAKAQYLLANCYRDGTGVEEDEKQAVEWIRKAAEQGYADAQYILGLCYANGQGIEKDEKQAFEWFRNAAEQGVAKAQYNLGLCYNNGDGVEKDEKQAFEWFRNAAKQGVDIAQYNLGVLYEHGIGVDKDEKKAFEWYTKAAVQGNSYAQSNLGMCYAFGKGIEKDEKKAVEWYIKAAEQGYAAAQCNLGACYQYGNGVEKDEKRAVEWYTEAAKKGYSPAQYYLGMCYQFGNGVEKDEKQAVKWYRKAVKQSKLKKPTINVYYGYGINSGNEELQTVSSTGGGFALAQCHLGVCYQYGIGIEKDEKQAVELFRKAAEQGYAVAQFNLGVCLENGIGVEKNEQLAVEWYRKAGEQGNALALCNLGKCYQDGIGVEKDEKEAFEWFKKAAEQSNLNTWQTGDFYYLNEENDKPKAVSGKRFAYATAQNNLGVCYEHGEGVEKDEKKAVELYRKAAEHGLDIAQLNLGECYAKGIGVEKDELKAIEWYKKAAEQGDEEAKIALQELQKANAEDFEKKYEIANAGKRYDLFISWNHNDKNFKDFLVNSIENYNFVGTGQNDEKVHSHYRAWDSDRDAEGLIEESIKNAINNSKFFLVILSQNSIKSDWVRLEVKAALERVENGTWSPKNLLIVYLNTPDFDVSKAIDEFDEDDEFRKLKAFAANFTKGEKDENAVKNICERIKSGLEADAIRRYINKITQEDDKFKYSLRNQYSKAASRNFGAITDALLSFEEGYIQRNVTRLSDETSISLEKLGKGASFYLYGEGGSGKSLYVSNMMRKNLKEDNFYLRVNLGEYEYNFDKFKSLTELLSCALGSYVLDTDEYYSNSIIAQARGDRGSEITIILDGLDELDLPKRNKLIDMVRIYRQSNTADRFIFTSRSDTCYPDLNKHFGGGLELYRLNGFERADSEILYKKISENVFKSNKREKESASREGLISPAVSGEYLKKGFFVKLDSIGEEIKKNPLLLSNLIFIYLTSRGEKLPTNEYEIVKESVGIFIDDLEDERGTLSRFAYSKYLTHDKIGDMLGSIALDKIRGDNHDFNELIVEYFKADGGRRCLDGDDPETVGNEIFNYLSRRAIISYDKISHDIFTAFFACCYLYYNIYEKTQKFADKYIIFRTKKQDASGKTVEESGEEYFKSLLNPCGNFGLDEGMWPEVSSELIMKLDYEINCLTKREMTQNNLNFEVFDSTLRQAVTERGISDKAIGILRALIKNGGLYFADFIQKYLN